MSAAQEDADRTKPQVDPEPDLKADGKPVWLSHPLGLCLLLAAMTFLVYWPVVHCDFVNYDDPEYFTSNPHVLAGWTWPGFAWAFTTGHAYNWHPLTWLSLMLDVSLFGKGPSGPHFTNLLLHSANAVLLFMWLRRLTATTWRSLLVAGLFALHPLHVESVAWVAERKDVLSTFFGLLALGAYTRYAQDSAARKQKFRYWLALLFFALSLMSKPMLVTLPFVLLLLDFWPIGRATGERGLRASILRLAIDKWPFFILSAASCIVTFIVQQKGGAVATLVKIPLWLRMENTFVAYARYLGKTFWPTQLAPLYPYPGSWDGLLVIYSATLVVGCCALAVLYGRRFPWVATGWFWFLGTLVPVIGIVQVGGQSMADRYTYLPLVGVFIIVAWGLARMNTRFQLPIAVAPFLAVAVLAACGLRTRDQIGYWQDSGKLFAHALAVTENNYVACNNLGTWLSKNNRLPEAMEYFSQSLSIQPNNPDALYNLGNAFVRLGDWDQAIGHYQRALQLKPAQADMLNNLGFALAGRKQFAEAAACFEAALKLDPNSASTHNNLAAVLFRENRLDEAVQQYREAMRLLPDDPRICVNLGDALARQGKASEAVKAYQTALRLNPGDPQVEAKLRALEALGIQRGRDR